MLPTLIELAESGAHYGHHKSHVYPKAKKFVFGIRKNIALIDLEQTLDRITSAQKAIAEVTSNGGVVLFVGTKRGVREIVQSVAKAYSSPFVTERWLGGFLTNFETLQENIKKMNELDEFLVSEKSQTLSKIDRLRMTSKLNRYHRFLGGVTGLKQRPDLMVMASASADKIALKEATQLNIPVIAICDTDIDPARVSFPIPANDDAQKAVELILNALIALPVKAKAVKEAIIAQENAEAETEAKPKAVAEKTAPKVKTAVKKETVKKATKKVAVKKEVKKATPKKVTKKTVK